MKHSENTIPVLAVRRPFAQAMMKPKSEDHDGRVIPLKSLEIKTRNTHIRGPVGVYISNNIHTDREVCDLLGTFYPLYDVGRITFKEREFLESSISDYHTSGHIIGTIDIIDSLPISEELFIASTAQHFAPSSFFRKDRSMHEWILRNPKPFKNPVKLDKWLSGGPWGRIPKSKLPEL